MTDPSSAQRALFFADSNMTQRRVGGTTYTYAYNEENRLNRATGGITTTNVYDGDGKRVKATVDGATTGYVGDWYEVANGVVKQYYSIGGVRVAMRDSGMASALCYLLTDHLGSTAVQMSTSLVKEAEAFLGSGYKEIANGVFRSTDGLRTVRMTPHELEQGRLHLNFETWRKGKNEGRMDLVENLHIYLVDAQ